MAAEEPAEEEERRRYRKNLEKRLRRKLTRARAEVAARKRALAEGLPYETPWCIQAKSIKRKEQRLKEQAKKQVPQGEVESTTTKQCAVLSPECTYEFLQASLPTP